MPMMVTIIDSIANRKRPARPVICSPRFSSLPLRRFGGASCEFCLFGPGSFVAAFGLPLFARQPFGSEVYVSWRRSAVFDIRPDLCNALVFEGGDIRLLLLWGQSHRFAP
jgi:hypothetical protein